MSNVTLDETTSDHKQITKQPNILAENMISEDGTLKYDFMISLENIALAKISTILWMNRRHEIAELYDETVFTEKDDIVILSGDLEEVQESVDSKVRELHLPKSIAHKLSQVLRFTGKCIKQWILYHGYYVFIPGNNSKYIAAQLIGYVAWTARGRIDYAQTAKNILADPECVLTDDHKYKLACCSCLDDEIAVIAPNVAGPGYLRGVDFEKQPMVFLHTASITSRNTKSHNIPYCRDYSSILHVLLKHYPINEAAIRYVWNELSVPEKSAYITKVIEGIDGKDFRYSLLSNLDHEKQQTVFREYSYSILRDMFDDWLMKEDFLSTALHVLSVMQPEHYCKIMRMIFRKMKRLSKNDEERDEGNYSHCREIKKYKCMFKQLWQGGSKYINVHLNSKWNMIYDCEWLRELVIFLLSSKHDMDLVQLVLDSFDAEEKKMIMYSSCCTYADIIKSSEWDIFQQLIKCTFSSKEDIDKFKDSCLNIYEISEILLEENAWNKLDSFLKWALRSDAEIAEFKHRTADVKCLNLPERLIDSENYFRDLENHLKWCANDDPNVIKQLKAKALKLGNHKAFISCLLRESKFELLDRILNFRFSNNQRCIVQFKSNIFKYSDFNWIFKFEPLSLKTDFSLNKLDEFVDWCFTDAQKVQEFKKWILRKLKRENFLRPLIITKRFREADEFINWCVDSTVEATTFKNMFMLSRDVEVILRDAHNHTQHELQSLIEWLNPSKETVAEFKKLFRDKPCPPTFFRLLDDFVCNQPAVGNDGEISAHDCNSNLRDQNEQKKKKLKKN